MIYLKLRQEYAWSIISGSTVSAEARLQVREQSQMASKPKTAA